MVSRPFRAIGCGTRTERDVLEASTAAKNKGGVGGSGCGGGGGGGGTAVRGGQRRTAGGEQRGSCRQRRTDGVAAREAGRNGANDELGGCQNCDYHKGVDDDDDDVRRRDTMSRITEGTQYVDGVEHKRGWSGKKIGNNAAVGARKVEGDASDGGSGGGKGEAAESTIDTPLRKNRGVVAARGRGGGGEEVGEGSNVRGEIDGEEKRQQEGQLSDKRKKKGGILRRLKCGDDAHHVDDTELSYHCNDNNIIKNNDKINNDRRDDDESDDDESDDDADSQIDDGDYIDFNDRRRTAADRTTTTTISRRSGGRETATYNDNDDEDDDHHHHHHRHDDMRRDGSVVTYTDKTHTSYMTLGATTIETRKESDPMAMSAFGVPPAAGSRGEGGLVVVGGGRAGKAGDKLAFSPSMKRFDCGGRSAAKIGAVGAVAAVGGVGRNWIARRRSKDVACDDVNATRTTMTTMTVVGGVGEGGREYGAMEEAVINSVTTEGKVINGALTSQSVREMENMQVVYEAFTHDPIGGLDVRKFDYVPMPSGSNDVVIRVKAASVCYKDCILRRGMSSEHISLPAVPGFDCIGVIENIGDSVNSTSDTNGSLGCRRPVSGHRESLAVGDSVAALVRTGGNARYVTVDSSRVFRVPGECDSAKAACILSAYMTAYQALHRVRPRNKFDTLEGKTVLVTGGIGPIGLAAIELSLRAGAVAVYATAEERYHAALRARHPQNGNIIPLPLSPSAWLPVVRGSMDCVLDGLCQDGYESPRAALNNTGTLICIGANAVLSKEKGPGMFGGAPASALWASTKAGYLMGSRTKTYDIDESFRREPEQFRHDVSYLFGLLSRGKIKPSVTERIGLERVPEMHRRIERGEICGGVVVVKPWQKR